MTDINEVKNELKVGDTMKLTIYRDGSTKEVSIKLIDQSTLSGTASSSGSDSSSSEDNSGSFANLTIDILIIPFFLPIFNALT